MKSKIIAIVVALVFTAGASTAIGVIVDRRNNKETASMINEAVSQALASTADTTKASTVKESTTEETATTEASTTTKPVESTATTNKSTTKKETTTVPPTAVTKKYKSGVKETTNKAKQNSNVVHTPLGDVYKNDNSKHKDENGYYWQTNFTYIPDTSRAKYYIYNIDENNNLFYFDDNGKRVYY